MLKGTLGIIFASLAAISWGTIGLIQGFVQSSIDATWIVVFRLLFASIFFIVCSVSTHEYKEFSRRSHGAIVPLILLAALCIAINNICFIYGVRMTGIAMGSASTIGSTPIWAGLLSWIVFKRSPSLRWWRGTILACVGVVVMIVSQASSWHISTVGLISCLIAGFCYSCFTIISGELVKTLSPLSCTTLIFSLALLIALPISLGLSGIPKAVQTLDWLVFLYLGLIPTGVAFLLYTKALQFITANTAVAMTLLDPVTSFCLALAVAKEPLVYTSGIGLIFILIGLRLVTSSDRALVQ